MEDFEAEIRQDFLVEADTLLEEAESALISLDSGQVSESLLDEIFRLAHNFKGSAKAVGFNGLSEFAHQYEELLTAVKNGNLEATSNVCSVLLKCLDCLKEYVAGLKSDENFSLDTSAINQEINNCLQSNEAPSSESLEEQKSSEENSSLEKDSSGEPEAPQDEDFSELEKIVSDSIAPPPKKIETPQKVTPQKKDEFIRVGTGKLDTMLNIVGELVVNQSVLANHRQNETTDSRHAIQTMAYMDKLVGELRDIALSLRMIPLKQLFQRMQRTARDLSRSENKPIEFVSVGEDVELDKTVVDRMVDPLTHLIRNAIDHGIESEGEREAAKKPKIAKVTLSAEQKEDFVVIRVSEDGRGLNKESILKKAIEKGLAKPGQPLSDSKIYDFIFQPTFSTKKQVTEVSGRGVGMNVVKEVVQEIKGEISIDTAVGNGTTFEISLPLSLSIISGMVVSISERKYVIPVSQLVETIEYKKLKIASSAGKGRMINLRGEVMPVFSLHDLLMKGRKSVDSENAEKKGIVTSHNGSKVSFEVDRILGQQQIVIKKLGKEIQGLPGILAGAILADGEPGLILDLHNFLERERKNVAA